MIFWLSLFEIPIKLSGKVNSSVFDWLNGEILWGWIFYSNSGGLRCSFVRLPCHFLVSRNSGFFPHFPMKESRKCSTFSSWQTKQDSQTKHKSNDKHKLRLSKCLNNSTNVIEPISLQIMNIPKNYFFFALRVL